MGVSVHWSRVTKEGAEPPSQETLKHCLTHPYAMGSATSLLDQDTDTPLDPSQIILPLLLPKKISFITIAPPSPHRPRLRRTPRGGGEGDVGGE